MPWRSHSARVSSKDDGASADARDDRAIRDRHDSRATTSPGSDVGIRATTYIA
jgi:hypothetical protein